MSALSPKINKFSEKLNGLVWAFWSKWKLPTAFAIKWNGCHRINGFSPQHIKEPSIIYSLHWQWHAMYAWILHFFANWIWSLNLPSTSTLWCGFGARRWSIFHVFPSPESPGVNITHLYKTKKVYFLGLAMRLRNMRRSEICGICGWCALANVSAWSTWGYFFAFTM